MLGPSLFWRCYLRLVLPARLGFWPKIPFSKTMQTKNPNAVFQQLTKLATHLVITVAINEHVFPGVQLAVCLWLY